MRILLFCLLLLPGFSNAEYLQRSQEAEQQDIRQRIKDFMTNWSHADAKALASGFMEDADLVNPQGDVFRTRHAIEQFYAVAFEHGYRGSQLTIEIRNIRLAGNTALVDGLWTISGVKAPAGVLPSIDHGLYTAWLEKQGGRWYILAMREMVPRQF